MPKRLESPEELNRPESTPEAQPSPSESAANRVAADMETSGGWPSEMFNKSKETLAGILEIDLLDMTTDEMRTNLGRAKEIFDMANTAVQEGRGGVETLGTQRKAKDLIKRLEAELANREKEASRPNLKEVGKRLRNRKRRKTGAEASKASAPESLESDYRKQTEEALRLLSMELSSKRNKYSKSRARGGALSDMASKNAEGAILRLKKEVDAMRNNSQVLERPAQLAKKLANLRSMMDFFYDQGTLAGPFRSGLASKLKKLDKLSNTESSTPIEVSATPKKAEETPKKPEAAEKMRPMTDKEVRRIGDAVISYLAGVKDEDLEAEIRKITPSPSGKIIKVLALEDPFKEGISIEEATRLSAINSAYYRGVLKGLEERLKKVSMESSLSQLDQESIEKSSTEALKKDLADLEANLDDPAIKDRYDRVKAELDNRAAQTPEDPFKDLEITWDDLSSVEDTPENIQQLRNGFSKSLRILIQDEGLSDEDAEALSGEFSAFSAKLNACNTKSELEALMPEAQRLQDLVMSKIQEEPEELQLDGLTFDEVDSSEEADGVETFDLDLGESPSTDSKSRELATPPGGVDMNLPAMPKMPEELDEGAVDLSDLPKKLQDALSEADRKLIEALETTDFDSLSKPELVKQLAVTFSTRKVLEQLMMEPATSPEEARDQLFFQEIMQMLLVVQVRISVELEKRSKALQEKLTGLSEGQLIESESGTVRKVTEVSGGTVSTIIVKPEGRAGETRTISMTELALGCDSWIADIRAGGAEEASESTEVAEQPDAFDSLDHELERTLNLDYELSVEALTKKYGSREGLSQLETLISEVDQAAQKIAALEGEKKPSNAERAVTELSKMKETYLSVKENYVLHLNMVKDSYRKGLESIMQGLAESEGGILRSHEGRKKQIEEILENATTIEDVEKCRVLMLYFQRTLDTREKNSLKSTLEQERIDRRTAEQLQTFKQGLIKTIALHLATEAYDMPEEYRLKAGNLIKRVEACTTLAEAKDLMVSMVSDQEKAGQKNVPEHLKTYESAIASWIGEAGFTERNPEDPSTRTERMISELMPDMGRYLVEDMNFEGDAEELFNAKYADTYPSIENRTRLFRIIQDLKSIRDKADFASLDKDRREMIDNALEMYASLLEMSENAYDASATIEGAATSELLTEEGSIDTEAEEKLKRKSSERTIESINSLRAINKSRKDVEINTDEPQEVTEESRLESDELPEEAMTEIPDYAIADLKADESLDFSDGNTESSLSIERLESGLALTYLEAGSETLRDNRRILQEGEIVETDLGFDVRVENGQLIFTNKEGEPVNYQELLYTE